MSDTAIPATEARRLAADFVALTKPRIISLLLVTALGGLLLRGVLRVLRASDIVQPAWSVYKFSLLYLALLFATMVMDRFLA